MGNSSTHYHFKQSNLPPYKPVATLPEENLRIHYLTKYTSELQSGAVPYREKRLKSGKLKKRGVSQKIQELRFKRAQKIPGDASKVTYGKDRYVIVAGDGSRAAKQVRPLSKKNDRVWFVKKEERMDAVQAFEFDDESTETSIADSHAHMEKMAQEESLEEELYRMNGYDMDGNILEPEKDPEEVMATDTLDNDVEEHEQEEAIQAVAALETVAAPQEQQETNSEEEQGDAESIEDTPQAIDETPVGASIEEEQSETVADQQEQQETHSDEEQGDTASIEETPQAIDETPVGASIEEEQPTPQEARSVATDSQNSTARVDVDLTGVEKEKPTDEAHDETREPSMVKSDGTPSPSGNSTPHAMDEHQPLLEVDQAEDEDELEREMKGLEESEATEQQQQEQDKEKEEAEIAKKIEESDKHIDSELDQVLADAQNELTQEEHTEEEQTEEEHTDDEGDEE
eukprot:CAMPEP_0117444336 /NCGR_PEP_ID=MMETSP0759-20121206/5186_1 /TAXON_ID=63605 /ORGANISM="Percolomonas cosmopolitus, Strain WS" /LENGTH=457 /DNA_ID=CAMNT_0005236395 /DNA_START=230 /DNA_END=1603 /DNA_ORIENTATION=-